MWRAIYALSGGLLTCIVAAESLLANWACCGGTSGTTTAVFGLFGAPFTLVSDELGWLFVAVSWPLWTVLSTYSSRRPAALAFLVTLLVHDAAVPVALFWARSPFVVRAGTEDDLVWLLAMPTWAVAHGWIWLLFLAHRSRELRRRGR